MKNKVISRICGGLGNQLFCYAAARRLSLFNNAELVIDSETGFTRDYVFKRKYILDSFSVKGRKANRFEKLQPLQRINRKLLRSISRCIPFERRPYIDQAAGPDFDARLLSRPISGTVWIDGLWQSEGYFSDIDHIIRQDFLMKPPRIPGPDGLVAKIQEENSVAIHVRKFEKTTSKSSKNAPLHYYKSALKLFEQKYEHPFYFVFSDDLISAKRELCLPVGRHIFVDLNVHDEDGLLDFWLMQKCKNFIIANSTFSWWAAWLSSTTEKTIVAPSAKTVPVPSWTFHGLLPEEWIKL